MAIATFKRYEKKYLITKEMLDRILPSMLWSTWSSTHFVLMVMNIEFTVFITTQIIMMSLGKIPPDLFTRKK